MTERTKSEPKKQKTRKGYEIPVPKRSEFDKLVKRAATPGRRKPPKP